MPNNPEHTPEQPETDAGDPNTTQQQDNEDMGNSEAKPQEPQGPTGEELVRQMREARVAAQQVDYMLNGIDYQMEEQAKKVQELVSTLSHGPNTESTKALGTTGNEIMKLLEKLDQVTVPQGDDSLRTKRRDLVKKGNRYLDMAEKHGFKI
eukprot:m.218745 g.218745  ORF g.218745 m.218745 type:complete len:151 (+) comp29959_c0_seq1:72-524(+)